MALTKFELICITPWTGMIAVGLSNDAMIATSIVPPPMPKLAETKEVSKRDVNYRPKTVQAFQPMVRSY